MTALPAIGVASYNGFVFNSTTETRDLRVTPVPDRAGRTFTHHTFSLTLVTRLAGRPADYVVADAIRRLTQPAAALVFTGRGVGRLLVNQAGPPDLKWGPVPKVVSLRPLGGGNSVELTWSVEWASMTCGDAVYSGQPMEFVYTLTIDKDQSGYSTRTYSATLRIPQTRRAPGDRAIRMTADEFQEAITPAPLEGFRRVPGTASVSEDKCELRLTVIDHEIGPNCPPPGVIVAEADHQIASEPGKLLTWTGTVNATYEMARGRPVSDAWEPFFALVRDRIAGLQAPGAAGVIAGAAGVIAGAAGAIAAGVAGRRGPVLVLPWQFTAGDSSIYDKTRVRLALTYRVVNATRDQILTSGGLWRPVPGSDWKLWAASVATHLGPRAWAGLVVRAGDDSIVDLCKPAAVNLDLRNRPPLNEGVLRSVPLRTSAALRNTFPPPTPASSWVEYLSGVRVEDEHGVVVGNTLPTAPLGESTLRSGAFNVMGASLPRRRESTLFPPAADVGPAGGRLDSSGAGETFAQQRTSPTLYVFLIGHAIRAGFPVPVPELLRVNGKEPVACNRTDRGEGFEQVVVGNCGESLYYARWKLRYVLTGDLPRGPLPVPPNPLQ